MRFTIKLGGSILEDATVRRALLEQIGALVTAAHELVVVHGGGKSLTRRLAQLGIESRFVGGFRVTDPDSLQVAVMVLAGEVNKRVVTELCGFGVRALGICGADGRAVRSVTLDGPEPLGRVGRAVAIERSLFELLLSHGIVPVVSSLALAADGGLHNVNADQMAAACTWGTGSDALVYLTDVPGVRGRDGAVIRRLDRAAIEQLRGDGVVSGGMLPKTGSCLEALEHGVRSVHILPGAAPDVLRRFVAGTLEEGSVIDGGR